LRQKPKTKRKKEGKETKKAVIGDKKWMIR